MKDKDFKSIFRHFEKTVSKIRDKPRVAIMYFEHAYSLCKMFEEMRVEINRFRFLVGSHAHSSIKYLS